MPVPAKPATQDLDPGALAVPQAPVERPAGPDLILDDPNLNITLESLVNLDPDIKFHLVSDLDDKKSRFVSWSRVNQTGFERRVFKVLGGKENPWMFVPQVEILGLVADFYTPKFRVVLEADGPDHDRSVLQDRARDLLMLTKKKIKVLRLTPLDLVTHTSQDLYRLIDQFVRQESELTPQVLDEDQGGLL